VKLSKIVITAVAGMLLLSAGAFARDKGSLILRESVTVQGKVLKPGEYKLTWEGTGPNVQLSIIRDRETVATVPATIVASREANIANACSTTKESDGSKSLGAYYPEGKKFFLELGQEEAAKH
jgi:hypothetical protein